MMDTDDTQEHDAIRLETLAAVLADPYVVGHALVLLCGRN